MVEDSHLIIPRSGLKDLRCQVNNDSCIMNVHFGVNTCCQIFINLVLEFE